LARRLGYSTPQFISNAERGISAVPAKSFKEFCRALNIQRELLLDAVLEDLEDAKERAKEQYIKKARV
jgi:transcriptional regulator with XRE-family HTH domain